MLNIIAIDTWDVCKAGLFCILLILAAVVIFKWLWVDHMVFDLPKGPYRSPNNEYGESLKVASLNEYVSIMWMLLWDLDIPYWLDYIGLEGYSYIYFIRCMMTELMVYFTFWSLSTLTIYMLVRTYSGNK
jgi:hypothetical protein